MTGEPARSPRSVYRSPEGQHAVQTCCTLQLDRWTVPHHRDYVSTCAGPTHVVTTGSGSPTVVVVPGTNFTADRYESLAALLALNWPTMLLDLPGQPGLSASHRPRRNRLTWYGRWLADVLARTVASPAVVLGHSLGGAIVLACDSPLISGRVLVSTAGLAALKVSPAILGATLPWLLRPTAPRSATLLRHFLAAGHAPDVALIDWFTLIARHCHSSLAPPVLPDQLLAQRKNVPCLVATGQHDVFLTPQRLRRPATEHLGTELRVIPDAGHLVTDERPEALVPLVDEMCHRIRRR